MSTDKTQTRTHPPPPHTQEPQVPDPHTQTLCGTLLPPPHSGDFSQGSREKARLLWRTGVSLRCATQLQNDRLLV